MVEVIALGFLFVAQSFLMAYLLSLAVSTVLTRRLSTRRRMAAEAVFFITMITVLSLLMNFTFTSMADALDKIP